MVKRVLTYKLGPVFFLCALLVGIMAGGPMAQAQVPVNVTISGEVGDEDEGIQGATVGVYDVANDPKDTDITNGQGQFELNFVVNIPDAEDAVWLYPGVRQDDGVYVRTYGPFAAISKSDDPVNITDVELALFEKELIDSILNEVDEVAEDVDPNLGLVAGVVEIEIDDPQPGEDDLRALEGATISWTDLDGQNQNVDASIIYFENDGGEPGAPDSSLTATSGSGAFLLYNIVLDGDNERDLKLTATKSGYTIPSVRVRAFPYTGEEYNAITFADFMGSEGGAAPAGDGGGGGGGCFISAAGH